MGKTIVLESRENFAEILVDLNRGVKIDDIAQKHGVPRSTVAKLRSDIYEQVLGGASDMMKIIRLFQTTGVLFARCGEHSIVQFEHGEMIRLYTFDDNYELAEVTDLEGQL